MSAFICGPDHFKALAIFATQRRYGSWRVDPRYIQGLEHPDKTLRGLDNLNRDELATLYAETLYQENVRSVAHRYPDSGRDDLPGPCSDPGFVYVSDRDCISPKFKLGPVAILKMCDCLEYQSCETDNYRQSVAFKLLDAIRGAAISALPGYDDAPWDFYADEQATA